jgi:hypothetical protein
MDRDRQQEQRDEPADHARDPRQDGTASTDADGVVQSVKNLGKRPDPDKDKAGSAASRRSSIVLP